MASTPEPKSLACALSRCASTAHACAVDADQERRPPVWHNEKLFFAMRCTMADVTEARVREILAGIVDPHTGVSLAEGRAVHAIGVDGDRVAVEVSLGYPARDWRNAFA
ncbi:MAG TPA: iron-sulfur cluster assembly protein, partial [Rhodanobacteraceae bacterium]|nr:iron-sulfur cluster assembly protein [Rhodanobacteraceae bacterium]